MTVWSLVGLAGYSLDTAVDESLVGSYAALGPPIPDAARPFDGVEPPAGPEFGP